MIFKTSLDGLAKGITLGVCILISLAIGTTLVSGYSTDPIGSTLLVGLIVIVVALCLLLRPLRYELTGDKLIVHRLLGDIAIKREDILIAKEFSKSDMNHTIRTLGVGGFFGYFGRFYNSKVGRITMYATRRSNAVLIDTGKKRIILTPDNPVELVRELTGNRG